MTNTNKHQLIVLIIVILLLSTPTQPVIGQVDTSKIGVNNGDNFTYEYTSFICIGFEDGGYCNYNPADGTMTYKVTDITLDSNNAITVHSTTADNTNFELHLTLDTLDFVIFTDWDFWESNAAELLVVEDADMDLTVEPIIAVDNGIDFFNVTSFYKTDFGSGGLAYFSSIVSSYYEKSTGILLHKYFHNIIHGLGESTDGDTESLFERTSYVSGEDLSEIESESSNEGDEPGFLTYFTFTALISIVLVRKKIWTSFD